MVAIYQATGIEGELRVDGVEGLDLRYFDAGTLPDMPTSSRRMLYLALEVLTP